MKTSFGKRVSSLIMALLMVLTLMPVFTFTVTAAAATLSVTDANIGLSYNTASYASWSASGNNITGTAKGSGTIFTSTNSTELTITNNHPEARTLSFSYALSNGGSVSGIISETSGSYSAELAAGASVKIKLTSPKGSRNTNTLDIKNIQLVKSGLVSSTFYAAENGSYTVDGVAITQQTVLEKDATIPYSLVATPNNGFVLAGWKNTSTNEYISFESSVSLSFAENPYLKPIFVADTTAMFMVGSTTYPDLTIACNVALSSTKKVILANNGILNGTHTIPAGVTLLIPFDSSNTTYTTEPATTTGAISTGPVDWVQPSAYRTLTMSNGSKITVNGAISVSAKLTADNGGGRYCGAPTGPCGWINMLGGSNITVNSGANLYVWGFIQGAGTITVNSGAKVYESFQFTDFRGGSNLDKITSEKLVFPMNQFYIQNIEVPTTYYAGAIAQFYTYIFVSPFPVGGGATFIGNGGMFNITEGYCVKDYIESRDRLNVDIYGKGSMSSLEVSISTYDVDSSDYVLSLCNNISINIHDGSYAKIDQSIAVLPGAEINIDKGATVEVGYTGESLNKYISNGYNLIVYDLDEWQYGYASEEAAASDTKTNGIFAFQGEKGGVLPVMYAPGRTYTRTKADLSDAILNVNGKLIVNGFLYTTRGGAAITSTQKTGEIVLNAGNGTDKWTTQANQGDALLVPINCAVLKNSDGSYLSTEGATAGSTYKICETHNHWYSNKCPECPSVITWVVNGVVAGTDEVAPGLVPQFSGETPVKNFDSDAHYVFAGWAVSENGAPLAVIPAVSQDVTYYAVFTSVEHKYATEVIGGTHTCIGCAKTVECFDVEGDSDHICDYGCGIALNEHTDTDGNSVCDECNELVFIYGDVDENGVVDIADLSLLAQYVAQWGVALKEPIADVDVNDLVDIADLSLLAQYVAQWGVVLGPQG